ncbi:hypothetical protein J3J51_00175 [Burkholderia pseudomallei]|uniref:hypothetical protein n=1 Tax=Burkholderia pseudomallei TaxID=28450 RepID=UPI001AA0055E|nr:hypothetical protein [Burkholderia pseudomallei]QTB44327.1 hypothetical protein J3B47_07275 [Burkholderia pseudomallei]QTB67305.1 hypothetical protein J3J51_00175 [Burkholderia pseudomallei]
MAVFDSIPCLHIGRTSQSRPSSEMAGFLRAANREKVLKQAPLTADWGMCDEAVRRMVIAHSPL